MKTMFGLLVKNETKKLAKNLIVHKVVQIIASKHAFNEKLWSWLKVFVNFFFFVVSFFVYFIKISKLALPGVMLKYE